MSGPHTQLACLAWAMQMCAGSCWGQDGKGRDGVLHGTGPAMKGIAYSKSVISPTPASLMGASAALAMHGFPASQRGSSCPILSTMPRKLIRAPIWTWHMGSATRDRLENREHTLKMYSDRRQAQ